MKEVPPAEKKAFGQEFNRVKDVPRDGLRGGRSRPEGADPARQPGGRPAGRDAPRPPGPGAAGCTWPPRSCARSTPSSPTWASRSSAPARSRTTRPTSSSSTCRRTTRRGTCGTRSSRPRPACCCARTRRRARSTSCGSSPRTRSGRSCRGCATGTRRSAPGSEIQFEQVEGLVIGPGVTMADLKGTITAFARRLFGQDRQVRIRSSYFPFTEPSIEVDIDWPKDDPNADRLTKGTGLAGDHGGRHGPPDRAAERRVRPGRR